MYINTTMNSLNNIYSQYEDPDSQKINDICKSLIGAKININYTISINNSNTMTGMINNCNITGDCLENIIYPYIKNYINGFEEGPKQSSPDYWNNNRQYEWELKTFMNSPCFDVSNFVSHINQLVKPDGIKRKLFRTKYLIFKYYIENNTIIINDFIMCNVWDLINYNGKYPISLQNKKGTWYNIRPSSFNEIKNLNKNPEIFINKICEAIRICPNQINNSDEIIQNITQEYNKLFH